MLFPLPMNFRITIKRILRFANKKDGRDFNPSVTLLTSIVYVGEGGELAAFFSFGERLVQKLNF